MATATPTYGSPVSLTITLNSLVSDANLLAGWQSTVIDNDTDDAIECLIGGRFVSHSTAPTTGKQIEVWVGGTFDDNTTRTATAGATDAALTLTQVKKNLLRLVAIIPTDASTSSNYDWGPLPLSACFGGVIPQHWFIWVVHNMVQILNASGNVIKYTPIKFQSS